MHTHWRSLIAVALLALSATGCPKKKDAASDAAAEAAAPVAVEDAAPAAPGGAVNAAAVARFPNETPLANVAEKFDRQAHVRDSPPAGEIIATLPAGTKVEQIAQRDRYFLILFDDPKDQQRKMGWVAEIAFRDVPAPKKLTCKAPDVAVIVDLPVCARICKADAECNAAAAETCTGKAKQMAADGGAGADVQTCVAHKAADAGAPPAAADAGGAVAAVDAGAKPDAGGPAPVADAGAPKPDAGGAAAATGPIVDPQGGACAATHRLVSQTGKCHLLCGGKPALCGKLTCTKKAPPDGYGEPAVCK
jgi:hypothetical protein